VSDADDPSTATGAGPSRVRDWRWWVGGLGKTLITVGLLMFGFVAYQLWGTGIETARAQNQLESEFEELLGGPAPAATSTLPGDGTTDPSVPDDTVPDAAGPDDSVPPSTPEPPVQELPAFEEGDAIARIEIPSIGVDKIVVAGVSTADLKKGPGHYPDTPMPGQLGNSAIAAHRTTYGQPFFDIDKVQPGDEVVMTTPAGRFVYRVTGTTVVTPADYWVVSTTDPTQATLTLTSCDPKWTARNRIVVSAEFDAEASSAPAGQATLDYGRTGDDSGDGAGGDNGDGDGDGDGVEPASPDASTTSSPTTVDDSVPAPSIVPGNDGGDGNDDDGVTAPAAGTDPDEDEIADAFSEGWFSDAGAWPQVVLWGLVLAAIAVGGSLLGRLVGRRWVGWLAGALPFAVCLYFFYQNVNRLLPPGL
jgi:sortase A